MHQPEQHDLRRCAIYARVSLEEQAEKFGLSSQLSELHDYTKAHGYDVLREFVDEGYSGGDLYRPALTQLRDAVREHGLDIVIIHDPDRLARKLAHQLIVTEEFEKRGVRLEFVTTPAADNMEGRLLLNVRGVIAEYEREKIRERTMRGRREKARQGLIVGGRCPYGYKAADGKYEIDEQDSQAVQHMFRWLLEDRLSIRQIVERLNTEGYRPYLSSRWGKSTVSRILRNEFYTGKGFYNRRQRFEPEQAQPTFKRNKKSCQRWRPTTEWITQAVPTIISNELFQAAQLVLKHNSLHCGGRPSKTIYLLRGILKCSSCGRKYTGVPIFKDKYYRCTGRERLANPRCDAASIPAARIEAFVWEYIVGLLSNPDLLTEKLAQHQPERDPDLKPEVQRISAEIQQIERKENRLLEALLDETIQIPGMREKAIALSRQKSALQFRKQALEAQIAAQGDANSIRATALRYCEILRRVDGLDMTARQKLLAAILYEVVLHDNEITIRSILPVSAPYISTGNRPQRADDWPTGIG